MIEAGGQTPTADSAQPAVYVDDDQYTAPDLREIVGWIRGHAIMLSGVLLVAVEVVWRGIFLNGMFFRQDDFHVLDTAIERGFSWKYLTFNGAGHLIIGPRAIAWPLARISLYDWRLDSWLVLLLVACAGLAALRLLRALFGDRPVVLLLLAIYIFSPLTLPVLGEWSAALEAVPLQLAIFMALNAHLKYVRTGHTHHLAAAVGWVAFGLIFFEKALVLPLLLFGITAAFLVKRRSLREGIRETIRRFWPAWLSYIVMLAAYGILLKISLRTSHVQPVAPKSLGSMTSFVWALTRYTLVPGAFGGPWRWFPPGGSYALASAPQSLSYLLLAVAAAVVAMSVWLRFVAWRAWLILAGWIFLADIVPVLIGRLDYLGPTLLGLDTRYVADVPPVIAICVGLAFLPLAEAHEETRRTHARNHEEITPPQQTLRMVAAGLTGVFAISSIWSSLAYESDTTGAQAANYISNATRALSLASPGTLVVNSIVPPQFDTGLFGKYEMASRVVGDIERAKLTRKLRWINSPSGTFDNLMTFGNDGRLHLTAVYGTYGLRPASNRQCWPAHQGRIVMKFAKLAPINSTIMRIGYIWGPAQPGFVTVRYGRIIQTLELLHGVNSAYLPVTGVAARAAVRGIGGALCVGDVEVGTIGAASGGLVLPRIPK